MGLPSVASRVPGCTDAVVDGVTGTLVPPYDPAALATAIARYIIDRDLRRLHGAAAKARVLRDFQPETIHLDVYRHYCDLLPSSAKVGQAQTDRDRMHDDFREKIFRSRQQTDCPSYCATVPEPLSRGNGKP